MNAQIEHFRYQKFVIDFCPSTDLDGARYMGRASEFMEDVVDKIQVWYSEIGLKFGRYAPSSNWKTHIMINVPIDHYKSIKKN